MSFREKIERNKPSSKLVAIIYAILFTLLLAGIGVGIENYKSYLISMKGEVEHCQVEGQIIFISEDNRIQLDFENTKAYVWFERENLAVEAVTIRSGENAYIPWEYKTLEYAGEAVRYRNGYAIPIDKILDMYIVLPIEANLTREEYLEVSSSVRFWGGYATTVYYNNITMDEDDVYNVYFDVYMMIEVEQLVEIPVFENYIRMNTPTIVLPKKYYIDDREPIHPITVFNGYDWTCYYHELILGRDVTNGMYWKVIGDGS